VDLLQKVVRNTLVQISIGNILNRIQKAQHLRETMNKWDCIKLKSFCTAKEMAQSPDSRDSSQNGRKSLPATHPIRDYLQGTQKTKPLKNQHPKEEIGT
jgi:hypothetical protein